MPDALKRCGRCKEEKPLAEFALDKSRAGGRRHTCRVCMSAEMRRQHARRQAELAEPPPEVKTCSKCREAKPLNRFYRAPRYALGVDSRCKDCRREWHRQYDANLKAQPKVHIETKVCTRCKEQKAADEFSRDPTSQDGRRRKCNQCRKETEWDSYDLAERKRRGLQNYLWSLYRLSLEDYEAMLESQQGNCAVCGEHMKKPNVDHCHITGRVRALLCSGCNTTLGRMERPRFIEKARAYLDKYK